MFQVLVKGRCGEPAHFSENYGSSNHHIRLNRDRCGHHSDISGNEKQLMNPKYNLYVNGKPLKDHKGKKIVIKPCQIETPLLSKLATSNIELN